MSRGPERVVWEYRDETVFQTATYDPGTDTVVVRQVSWRKSTAEPEHASFVIAGSDLARIVKSTGR